MSFEEKVAALYEKYEHVNISEEDLKGLVAEAVVIGYEYGDQKRREAVVVEKLEKLRTMI